MPCSNLKGPLQISPCVPAFPFSVMSSDIMLFLKLWTHCVVAVIIFDSKFLCWSQLLASTSRMYQDKLAQLKKQLQQLKDGTLPEYMKKLKKLEQQHRERMRMNEIWYAYEVSTVMWTAYLWQYCSLWLSKSNLWLCLTWKLPSLKLGVQ